MAALALLLLHFVALTHAQEGEVDATALPPNATLAVLDTMTPEPEVMASIFSNDVAAELPDQSSVQEEANFQWELLLNSSSLAPFILCTTEGYAGVQAMLAPYAPRPSLPVHASANLTCFVVYDSAPRVANSSLGNGGVRYASPVPMVSKVARSLFSDADSGRLFQDPEDLLSTGLRVVLSPGQGKYNAGLSFTLRRLREGLLNGAYRGVIENNFFWTGRATKQAQMRRAAALQRQSPKEGGEAGNGFTGPPPRRARLRRSPQDPSSSKPRYLQEEAAMPETGNTSANVTVSNRGEAWLSHLAPVLNGSFLCPWRRLAMTTQKPYLRVDRLQVRAKGGYL